MSTEQISLFDMLPEQEDATNHRGCTFNNNRMFYLNIHGNQADYNKIT